ncbi:unnamed protein product [Didymodactylos carnosus]|uniref:Uncharacterized protein n=1 Tax=Didymodactylos carnosus TaxID=1234261 RepID=A0A813RIW0_9BILA|nr:unnamed protein product [Didymodactylos carnosus]CAF0785175.1 unnamed protein product [Didymodactylos carnosus]CAF3531109.1 unnamed protein product [Didymodactylos carnosus]CAF3568840.1 unnamed protein product [Didymodactylos carnosus]
MRKSNFHWIITKKEPMIEDVQPQVQKDEIHVEKTKTQVKVDEKSDKEMSYNMNSTKPSEWQSDETSNEYLRRFRNYEI